MFTDFKKLMTARFLYTFAVEMQSIMLGWQMYLLTKSAFYLGMIGLAEAIPALGLALYAGYLVDRSRPLIAYRAVLQISLLSCVIMLGSLLPGTGMSVTVQVYALFFSSALTGTARSFSQPAIFSIVPKLVSRTELPKATACMMSIMQTARITGPAVGGLLFGVLSISTATMVPCVLLLIAVAVTFGIAHPERIIAKTNEPLEPRSFKAELFSGVHFVFNHPILFPAMALDMVSVLFGGVTALLPIYAADILQSGAQGLGMLRAAPAIGAVLVGLFLANGKIQKTAGPWFLSAVTGFGFSILVFSISTNFWLSVVALALSGGFDSISMVIRSSAVQLSSPDAMRGRISAVNSMFIGSSNEIGEFESGVVASLLGTVPAAVLGSIACIATVGIVAVLCPTLRKLDLTKLEAASSH